MQRRWEFNWVEHDDGYSVYVWFVSVDGRSLRKRQRTWFWVPRPQPAESAPDLLRRLAHIMELPLSDRPMSGRPVAPAPPGGPQGDAFNPQP
jgi:hypothetical protein